MQDKQLATSFNAELDGIPAIELALPSEGGAIAIDVATYEGWLDDRKKDDESADERVNVALSLEEDAALIELAAYDVDVQQLLAVDTNYQAVVEPPSDGGGSGGGFWSDIHPLVWTAAGVGAVALLDSSDSDGSNGNSSGNRAPTFSTPNQQLTIDEDSPLLINAVATDRDGDELTYDIPSSSAPDHGDVVAGANPGEYTYTPDAEFSGEDSFVIRVRDGNGGVALQTVTITINNVNDTPVVAQSQTLSGNTGQLFQISVPAQDAEGDQLTYTFTSAENGTVSAGDSPGTYLYAPSAGFSGTDSFTVTVSDGNTSATQTVNLRVGLANEAPVVEASQEVSTDEDEEITVQVTATDIDGDTLSYSAGAAANGTVTASTTVPGRFLYTPNDDFNGQDSFVVTVSDGKGGTATQTVTVNVAPAEDTYELTVPNAEAAEGDDGSAQMVFELSLDRAPFNESVTVNVKSVNGTATAGDDFVAVDTTVTFEAGQKTVQFVVELLGDTVFGADELFTLNFSGDKLDKAVSATGKLLNDDLDPTIQPPVLSLDAASDTGDDDADGLTSDSTPSFTIQGETNAIIEMFANGSSIGMATAGTGGTYTFTAPALGADGDYTITARMSFAGINGYLESAELPLTLDATAPGLPVVNLDAAADSGANNDDNVTAETAPSFTIAAEAGATVEIFRDAVSVGFATESTESPGSFSFVSTTLADGEYDISAVATDLAGNSATSADLTVRIDTQPPAAPVVDLDAASDSGVSDSDNVTAEMVPTFTIIAESGATVEIFRGGASVGFAVEDSGNPGSYSFTSEALSDGDYSFTAIATDIAGNVGDSSQTLAVTIDATAPDAPVVAMAAASDSGVSDSDGITSATTPVFLVSAAAGTQVEVFADGESLGFAVEDEGNPGQYAFTTPVLGEGNVAITATATDVAGNISAASLASDATIDTSAPAIAALTANAEANTATVTFDEDIGLIDDSQFSFTINDVAGTVIGFEQTATDSVTFTFAEDLVGGDTVDVALALAAVSDFAGNGIAVVDFSDDPNGFTV